MRKHSGSSLPGSLAQASGNSAEVAVITVPGQTISLKNSKQFVRRGGFTKLIPSDAYGNWADSVLWQLKQSPYVGHKWRYPLRVSFWFFRKTRQKFDFINIAQGPLDLLQEAGIIEGDDMTHVIPGNWYWDIDKENPRVELVIEELGQ